MISLGRCDIKILLNTISVVINRIRDGDQHRFVNYDFPFSEPDEPRLNSIETRERNWVKAPFRDAQATSATDNHKNAIFDRGSKAKLGQGVGARDDHSFVHGSESVARRQDLVRIPIVRENY
jgi:hypothetical protein